MIPNCFSIRAALTLWPGGSLLGYKRAADHKNQNSKVVGMIKAKPHLTVGSAELKSLMILQPSRAAWQFPQSLFDLC